MSNYLPTFSQLKYLSPIGILFGIALILMSIWGVNELVKNGHLIVGGNMKLTSVVSILASYKIAKLSAVFYAGVCFILVSLLAFVIVQKLEYSN